MRDYQLAITAYKLKESDYVVFDRKRIANTDFKDFEEVTVFIPKSKVGHWQKTGRNR